MSDRIVYLNGKIIPESQAMISIWDRGFILGDAVFDTARTFNHKPFRIEDHIDRLYRSMRYIHIECGISPERMINLATEIIDANVSTIDADDDLVVTIRVTRGSDDARPTVLITSMPVNFGRFAHLYESGVHLITPTVRSISRSILDPRVKTQSRMVSVMAELQAEVQRPGAWPLLLNSRGIITESARASFFVVRNGSLLMPKGGRVLAGVTAAVTTELALGLGVPVEERDLTPYDALQATEAFLTSTSMCVLPAASLNGSSFSKNTAPGKITTKLMDSWKEYLGMDNVTQALRFADRSHH